MPSYRDGGETYGNSRFTSRNVDLDECEICRTEFVNTVVPVCSHMFCQRCLAKYKICPLDGARLHQSPCYLQTGAFGRSRNVNSSDRADIAQTETTTVTKTTHTTTDLVPCALQPVHQPRDERWSDRTNANTRQSTFEDHSHTTQRTTMQTQTPQQFSAVLLKEPKAEILVDAGHMIKVMYIEVDFVLQHRDYFNAYMNLMREVCRRWEAELWRRDGMLMLKSDLLNMLEAEIYEIFDARHPVSANQDLVEMPWGLKHGFHRAAVSIAKIFPESNRLDKIIPR